MAGDAANAHHLMKLAMKVLFTNQSISIDGVPGIWAAHQLRGIDNGFLTTVRSQIISEFPAIRDHFSFSGLNETVFSRKVRKNLYAFSIVAAEWLAHAAGPPEDSSLLLKRALYSRRPNNACLELWDDMLVVLLRKLSRNDPLIGQIVWDQFLSKTKSLGGCSRRTLRSGRAAVSS
ncbi:hypothetical protein [Methylobacterium tardum]|uniref:hypothetical protein n=1 Tax=Methylobacterium tardum TaxID=374432 RepID=UPI001EDCF0AE|nr:hypothetical protein [Methylobacterium tardum]URD34583.1 hypothetical protein M6G65_18460 [Methylobacterium tardum]